jgi:hypothetical protein
MGRITTAIEFSVGRGNRAGPRRHRAGPSDGGARHACPERFEGPGIGPVEPVIRSYKTGSREVTIHDLPWNLGGSCFTQSNGV